MTAGEFKKLVRNRRLVLIVISVIILNVVCSLYMSYNRADKTTGLTARDLSSAFSFYVKDSAEETLEVLEEKQDAIMGLWIDESGNIRIPSEEQIRELTPATGSLAKELNCITVIYEYAEQIGGYGEYLDNIQKNAEEIKQSSFARRADYTIRNIDDTAVRYRGLGPEGVVLYNYFGAESVLNNSISVFIVLAAALYFCLELFVSDKYDGTLALIKTTKNSRRKLFAAKAAVLCVLVFFVFTVVYASNVAIAARVYGLGDLSVRIQSVVGYYTSPWNMSVGGCMIFSYAAGLLGTIVLSLLIALLCVATGSIIGSVGLTAGVFLIEFAAYCFVPYHSPFSLVSRINLFSLADVRGIFADYTNINICNYPVNNLTCVVISFVIVLLLGTVLGNKAWDSMKVITESRTGVKLRDKQTARVCSVFGYEMKKLLVHSKGTVCVALLLAAEILLCVSFGTYESNSDRWYERYSEGLTGPYSSETQAAMDSIDAEFEEIKRQIDEYQEKAASGEISADYAKYLIEAITPGADQTTGHRKAKAQFEYVKSQIQGGKASEYVPTVPYEKLLDRNEEILSSIPLFLVISVCIPVYASIEKRYGMGAIITSTSEGSARILKKKRLVVALFSVAAVVLAYAPRVVMKLAAFPLQMLGSPANSLECFGNVPDWVSIGLMLLAVAVLRLLAISVYGLLLFGVSRNSARPTLVIVLSLIITLLPGLMNLYGYENDLLLLFAVTGLYS